MHSALNVGLWLLNLNEVSEHETVIDWIFEDIIQNLSFGGYPFADSVSESLELISNGWPFVPLFPDEVAEGS